MTENSQNARFVAHLRMQPGRRFVHKFNDRIRVGVPDMLVIGAQAVFIEAKKADTLAEGWKQTSEPQRENLRALSDVATTALLVYLPDGTCALRQWQKDRHPYDVDPHSLIDMVKYVCALAG